MSTVHSLLLRSFSAMLLALSGLSSLQGIYGSEMVSFYNSIYISCPAVLITVVKWCQIKLNCSDVPCEESSPYAQIPIYMSWWITESSFLSVPLSMNITWCYPYTQVRHKLCVGFRGSIKHPAGFNHCKLKSSLCRHKGGGRGVWFHPDTALFTKTLILTAVVNVNY